MKCLICRCSFSVKKRFSNLLYNEKYLICDKCYKIYPMKINYSCLPIDMHNIHIYYIYPKPYCINSLAYSYEYSKLFDLLFSHNPNELFFSFDYFRMTNLKLDIFQELSSFYNKDIYIICNYLAE